MKILLTFASLFISSTYAFAAPVSTTCSFQDYTAINKALEGNSIVKGSELAGSIQGVLILEAPIFCEAVTDANLVGIPGDKYFTYRLGSVGPQYEINVVVHGVEGGLGTSSVYLTKLN